MDRNVLHVNGDALSSWSLSARRAWIEIVFCVGFSSGAKASLSARRAWIEIFCPSPQVKPVRVALRKESVDRNFFDVSLNYKEVRRSPQGERG